MAKRICGLSCRDHQAVRRHPDVSMPGAWRPRPSAPDRAATFNRVPPSMLNLAVCPVTRGARRRPPPWIWSTRVTRSSSGVASPPTPEDPNAPSDRNLTSIRTRGPNSPNPTAASATERASPSPGPANTSSSHPECSAQASTRPTCANRLQPGHRYMDTGGRRFPARLGRPKSHRRRTTGHARRQRVLRKPAQLAANRRCHPPGQLERVAHITRSGSITSVQ